MLSRHWFNPGSLYLLKTLQGWFAQSGLSPVEGQGMSGAVLYGIVQKFATLQAIKDTFYATFLVALTAIALSLLITRTKPAKSGEKHVVIE